MNGNISEDISLDLGSLTGEGTPEIIQMLRNENRLLKENLALSSNAMMLACEKLAAAKDQFIKERQEFDMKCQEAKEVVTALREEVQQKTNVIDLLKQQAIQDTKLDKTDNEHIKSQLAVLKNSLEAATQERDELNNKYVSLEMQLDSVISSSEDQRKQDKQTIELLQKTIESLQKAQTKERNEKQELSESLDHLRGTFDDLLLEYEKLINDEKMNKRTLSTKESQIQHLQHLLQKSEMNISALETKVEMYRSDFESERKVRELLSNQCVTLKAHLTKLTMPRDGQRFPAVGPSSLNVCPKNDVCICPRCGHKAPNIETLHQHCQSCSI